MKKVRFYVFALALFLLVGMVNVNAAEEVSAFQEKINAVEEGTPIVLDKDYLNETTLEVTKDQDVTIDLNGKTLKVTVGDSSYGTIYVYGNLTIKDSTGKGKIIADYSFVVDGGLVTVESGNIEITNDYGIYCKNGGSAIINGGTIESFDSVLAGNNTTGTMKFVINGGTLTAQEGPAIYMPGPVSLDITGGTLNGGVSLRMGEINISGGTLNAVTENIDSPAEYYSYGGNAWLPDALYVFGGTYGAGEGNDNYTNALNLNITGGTFNCTNGVGSAVAIYDLGKVSQSMEVTISGNAILNTKTTTRSAYQVLSLSDIGVTNPKEGYNNESYVGHVHTRLYGGTYSTEVDKDDVVEGYVVNEVNGSYVIAEPVTEVEAPVVDTTKKVENITVGVADSDAVKGILESALETSKIDTTGKNVTVNVTIVNQKESDINKEVATDISAELDKSYENATIAGFFDITLDVIDTDNNTNLGNLTELGSKIKLSVVLPEELQNVDDGYTRNYYIIRYHNADVEILNATLADDGNSLSFETDKFSTYALAYEDVEKIIDDDDDNNKVIVDTTDNPNTYDGITLYIGLGALSLIGIVAIVLYCKKKKIFN